MRPRRAQHAQTERSEADAVDRAGATDDVDRRRRELRAVHLHLDDDARFAIAREHLGERRHVHPPQLVGGPIANRPAQGVVRSSSRS